jgi:hypothetical protein
MPVERAFGSPDRHVGCHVAGSWTGATGMWGATWPGRGLARPACGAPRGRVVDWRDRHAGRHVAGSWTGATAPRGRGVRVERLSRCVCRVLVTVMSTLWRGVEILDEELRGLLTILGAGSRG